MRLSQLIAGLEETMDEIGDAEHVALCIARGGDTPRRADFFGMIHISHDTANYPNGLVYLVVDAKAPVKRPQRKNGAVVAKAPVNIPPLKKVAVVAKTQEVAADDDKIAYQRISHPKPGVTVHRCL